VPSVNGRPGQGPNDLGFGSVVSRESRQRLLNRDGSFNVERVGIPWYGSMSLYHTLISTTWTRFLGLVSLGYLLANLGFALVYYALGPGSLHGPGVAGEGDRLWQCFFFSVQTLATIGYGVVSPASHAANVVVAVESVTGLVGFALVSGIAFARFARPVGRFMFSERALVAPFQAGSALMFRATNARQNQMVDVHARVLLARRTGPDRMEREFIELALEREHVAFFPLTWTVVHPITASSPLWGATPEALGACDTEFIVLISGVDETFSQTVFARTSYRGDEIVFGARFVDAFDRSRDDGIVRVDVRKLSQIEPVDGAGKLSEG
jgi:inward rectifier potassium channel